MTTQIQSILNSIKSRIHKSGTVSVEFDKNSCESHELFEEISKSMTENDEGFPVLLKEMMQNLNADVNRQKTIGITLKQHMWFDGDEDNDGFTMKRKITGFTINW